MHEQSSRGRAASVNRRRFIAGATVLGAAPPALASSLYPAVVPLDRILIEKSTRRMSLLRGDATLVWFHVALGRADGQKTSEGDDRTPEGLYYVDDFNTRSEFYRAVHISYPNFEDSRRAAALGVRPGGQIMIHGLDPSIEAKWQSNHWRFNWTRGCIAVTNPEMDVIWESVSLGTPVEIRA